MRKLRKLRNLKKVVIYPRALGANSTATKKCKYTMIKWAVSSIAFKTFQSCDLVSSS